MQHQSSYDETREFAMPIFLFSVGCWGAHRLDTYIMLFRLKLTFCSISSMDFLFLHLDLYKTLKGAL
jgi:hypothetical protein